VLPAVSLSGAEIVAERLRSRVAEKSLVYDERLIAMTISIGLATKQTTDRTFDQILARADAALYRAKDAGRNRVVSDGL
jgi:diguanylate cyclase (GGDEF)-like protein